MTVAQLQSALRDLGRLLDAAELGNRTAVSDLIAFAPQLTKFGGLKLKDFGDLLDRLDLSGTVAPKPQRARAGKTKACAPDPVALAAEAHELYGRAADRSLPDERFFALFQALDTLTKEGLLTVAGRIEMHPAKSVTKSKLLEAICSRIEDRRGATMRRNMLDRPPAPAG